MRLHALRHLVECARALGECRKLIILGSASLLVSFPEFGDEELLELTCDADLLPEPVNEELAACLQEAIGRESLFHSIKGYYADILRPAVVESLPPGWETRLVRWGDFENVFALDPCDLVATKLTVGREKDLLLASGLFRLGKILPEEVRGRLAAMPLGEREMFRAARNFALVLGGQSSNFREFKP